MGIFNNDNIYNEDDSLIQIPAEFDPELEEFYKY